MADRLQWFLELGDKLTGPATRIERQLKAVRAELKAMDIAAKQNKLSTLTDPLKRQRLELQLQRDRLRDTKEALEKTGWATKRAAGDSGNFIGRLHSLLHIAQIVGGALERMGRAALDVGRDVAHAISFKQGSMIGLEAILGKGASGTFERLEELASRIGKPIAEVVNLGRTLANVGVKAEHLEPMIRLIEDLDAMDPGAGEKLAGVIRGIFSTGFMGVGDIEAMRGTLLRPEKLFEAVDRSFGGKGNRLLGKAALEQLNSSGTGIGPNSAAQLLLGQVLGLEGGRAGSASGRRGLTLESRMSRVGTNLERMFSRLSSSPGVKAFSKLLDRLGDLFDPDTASGKGMLGRLEQLSTALAKALEPLVGPDGKKNMEAFLSSMAEHIDKVLPGIQTLVEAAAFLAKYGILKPIEALGYGAKGGALRGKTIGEITGDPLADLTARELERRSWAIPGARAMDRANAGLKGAEVNVVIQVDARGASKDDANHIADVAAQKAKDAIADELIRIASQAGAFIP